MKFAPACCQECVPCDPCCPDGKVASWEINLGTGHGGPGGPGGICWEFYGCDELDITLTATEEASFPCVYTAPTVEVDPGIYWIDVSMVVETDCNFVYFTVAISISGSDAAAYQGIFMYSADGCCVTRTLTLVEESVVGVCCDVWPATITITPNLPCA